jgi:hypothetical protein
VSFIMFSTPEVCRTSQMCSEMKARCRC